MAFAMNKNTIHHELSLAADKDNAITDGCEPPISAPNPSITAQGIAARIWYDRGMRNIAMDPTAAARIAAILDEVLNRTRLPAAGLESELEADEPIRL